MAFPHSQTRTLAEILACTIKAALGIGLLYFPSELAKTGYAGLAVVVLAGVLSLVSFYACARTTQTTQKFTYHELGAHLLGNTGKWTAFFFFFVYLFGTCMVFFSTMALYLLHTAAMLVPAAHTLLAEILLTAALFFLVSALCCCSHKNVLACLPAAGLVGIAYIYITMGINILVRWDLIQQRPADRLYNSSAFSSFFLALVFAFANQFVYMDGLARLRNPTRRRQNRGALYYAATVSVVAAGFSATGYYLFGPLMAFYEPADILSVGSNSAVLGSRRCIVNGPRIAALYRAGTLLMLLAVMATFPLALAPLREMLLDTCITDTKKRLPAFYVLTFSLCSVFSVLSVLMDIRQIDTLIKYVSGIACSVLCFFLPALFFLCSETPFKTCSAFDIAVFLTVLAAGILSAAAFITVCIK